MTRGLDHDVSEGPGDTVLRRRRPGAEGLDATAEAALLTLVRPLSPIPVFRVLDVWPAADTLMLEHIPGQPLLPHLGAVRPQQALRLGRELGDLVATLACIPRAHVEHLVPVDVARPAELIAEATDAWDGIRDAVPPSCRGRVEAFLGAVPDLPACEPVVCHQDLGAEHIFVDGPLMRITGVIDWSDAALGDPALDLGLVLRDLGPAAAARAVGQLEARGIDMTGVTARALFHARLRALEDLSHGLTTDQDLYRVNALRAIERLFHPDAGSRSPAH